MKLSNKTYDILKWVALVAIPALEAFWLTVGKVWGFPYLTEIGTTIAAVGLLIATLIGVSSVNYYSAGEDEIEVLEDEPELFDYDDEDTGDDIEDGDEDDE